MKPLSLAAAFVCLAAGCSKNPTAPTPAPAPTPTVTAFVINSPPGEPIGRGQTKRLTIDNADFSVALSADHSFLRVFVRERGVVEPWTLQLSSPAAGVALAPGTYVGVSGHPDFGNRPTVSVGGNGFGCGSGPTGRYTVTTATFDGARSIRRFSATFEYRCETAALGLTGEIHIVDLTPSSPATSATPNVAGAWSGRIETDRGVGPATMTLQQSGAVVTGTWTASSFNWSGTVTANMSLGGPYGVITFDGIYPWPSGPRCTGTGSIQGFLSPNPLNFVVYWVTPVEGSCSFWPTVSLVMQSRS